MFSGHRYVDRSHDSRDGPRTSRLVVSVVRRRTRGPGRSAPLLVAIAVAGPAIPRALDGSPRVRQDQRSGRGACPEELGLGRAVFIGVSSGM